LARYTNDGNKWKLAIDIYTSSGWKQLSTEC